MNRIKKLVIIFSWVLLFPASMSAMGGSNYVNFLPMEDAMSAARNAPAFVADNTKPYRQSLNLVSSDDIYKRDYFDFTTTDVLAFILLAGIYLVFVKKDAKSRNTSF